MGESGMRWEQAAAEICAAVENIAAKIARNAANNLYETVMTSVQDYLRENVEFNLSSELQGYADTARRLRDENEQLKRRADLVEPMVEALDSCREYFDNRSDAVDGDYGQPEPNAEMALLTEIDAAILRARQAMQMEAR